MAAQAKRFLAGQDWHRAKTDIYNIYNREQLRRCVVTHQVTLWMTLLAHPPAPPSRPAARWRRVLKGCFSAVSKECDRVHPLQRQWELSTSPF